MSRKGHKKLRFFQERTRNTDFKNTETIVLDFIESIEDYKVFQLLENGGDTKNAGRKLKYSGTKAYMAMELAYKNRLHYFYEEQRHEGKLSQSEYDSRQAKLRNDRKLNHFDLKEMFIDNIVKSQVVSDVKPDVVVDLELILRGASNNNNKPKHKGGIPNPLELRRALNEMTKFFKKYIDPYENYPVITDSLLKEENAWLEMKHDCDDFDESNCYILIAPKNFIHKKDVAVNLLKFNWDLVLDFDPKSDINGFESIYEEVTKIKASIRDLSITDINRPIRVSGAPYWVLANGYDDKPESVMKKYQAWKTKYGQQLFKFFNRFYSVYSKPAKVIVMQGTGNEELAYIVGELNSAYLNDDGETSNIDFYLLSGENEHLEIEYENFKTTALTLEDLSSHIAKREIVTGKIDLEKQIPTAGGYRALQPDFLSKFFDFAQIVYVGIEFFETDNDDPRCFYDGSRSISWMELKNDKDVPRKAYVTSYKKTLNEMLGRKGQLFYHYDYFAGYGGTTQLRRIAWDFHDTYPVIIIRNYSSEQKSRFVSLFNLCKLPLLILIDSNDMSIQDARFLSTDLQTESFSHVICYLNRNEKTRSTKSDKAIFILDALSRDETIKMKDILLPYSFDENCKKNLHSICDTAEESEDRSPFIMALTAMDKDFKGVKPYITNYLTKLNAEQKKLIVYVALVDYANKYLDLHFFENLFRNPNIDSEFLSEIGAFRMLVSIVKRNPKKRYCKIKYHRFAQEILIQVSTSSSGDKISFVGLFNYILNFIGDSRPSIFTKNFDTITLLRDLFITREEDAEAIKPNFAPIIQRLIDEKKSSLGTLSQEDQLMIGMIFEKLVNVYPEEPHFLAHLARFNFYIEKDFDKGLQNINQAIELNKSYIEEHGGKKDSRLYHIKAMGYVAKITNKLIPNIKRMKNISTPAEIDELFIELKKNVTQAQGIFKDVRGMNAGIAGHISDINLCIELIGLGRYMQDESDTANFLKNTSDSWYVQLSDLACSLYEECSQYDPNDDSFEGVAFKEISGLIDEIKGNLPKAISTWENYLIHAPEKEKTRIRRMLARAYIENSKRNADQVQLKKIAELMQQNILYEPTKSSNIRIWFKAIRNIKADNPAILLDEALIKLNQWAVNSDSIDAFYYLFILTFIKAVDGSMDAEGRLPKLLAQLKSKSGNYIDRTKNHYWLGKTGIGIERLVSNNDLSLSNEAETMDKLLKLTGRVNEKYVNENHAYITAYRTDVFFKPLATRGEISRDSINNRVEFCVGFSYDGPRAYNASVKPKSTSDDIVEPLKDLAYGVSVTCEVKRINLEHFIDVRIVGYECQGSIHVDLLAEPYSNNNRPVIGTIIEATVLKSKYLQGRGMIWELTMKNLETINEDVNLPEYKKKLLEFKKDINTK